MKDVGPMLVWIVVLVLAVMAGGVAISVLRQRLFDDAQSSDETALSLDGLRKMRAEEQISQEEFERMRAALLASMGYDAEDPPGGDKGGSGTESGG